MSSIGVSVVLAVAVAAAGTLSVLHYPWARSALQYAAEPGALSGPHAFLEYNCSACHTPVKGVEAKNCIVCHADNKSLLQRQPSAFHADVPSCAGCHEEHQGRIPSMTTMDHTVLARLGQAQTSQAATDPKGLARPSFLRNVGVNLSRYVKLTERPEALLNCTVCHQSKDRHVGLFGNDCAQCHSTEKWTLSEYRHPSPGSKSCAQCHQAPPSHYMMHFKMVSMAVTHMEKAEVNQCFLCHQTTSWNDIKSVGWYKHH